MSVRAIHVLSHVDLVAAEDTRTSKTLLNHYQIPTKLTSYHDHNKEKTAGALVDQLLTGQSIAVISDAGTPGISDPAYYLVNLAIDKGCRVECIPGASAFLAALVISGLPTDRFCFEGFLPVKKGRQSRLAELAHDSRTLIFYESPFRVKRTLSDLYQALGDRPVVVTRELTKKFEQIMRGSLSTMTNQLDTMPIKGEFVILVGGLTRKFKKDNKGSI